MKNELSITDLSKRALDFAAASCAPSTKKAYQSDWRQFIAFCEAHNLEIMPASTNTVNLFMSDMATNHAVASISRALTSVGKAHELNGFESPTKNSMVSAVLKGIRRECGKPVDSRAPISYSELLKMAQFCDGSFIGLRDRALLMLGWCAALRRSELVGLDVDDLHFEDKGLILTLRRSKTDQEGRGRQIGVLRNSQGPCPVAAIEIWLNRRFSKGLPTDTPLFVSIGPHGRGKWIYTTGSRLSDRMVSIIVKSYAKAVGLLPVKYAAHSLRRGLATEAGARGVPERIIARHTGHRSISVLRSYIERGSIWSDNPLTVIYSPSSSPIPSFD